MMHNIQINIRAPAEAHGFIIRLGEILRSRPDLLPVLGRSVRDMETLAEGLSPNEPMSAGGVLELLDDIARRLNVLEVERANAAPPAPHHDPLNPRPSSPVAQLRRKAGLPAA